GRQITVLRASRAHVVFGMNLEETDVRPRLDDRAIVLGLEADATARRNRIFYGRMWKRHLQPPAKRRCGQDAARPARFNLQSSLLLGQASGPFWRLHGRAGAFGLELEGIALVVDCAGSGAAGARSCVAVVLALEGHAVALLHLAAL